MNKILIIFLFSGIVIAQAQNPTMDMSSHYYDSYDIMKAQGKSVQSDGLDQFLFDMIIDAALQSRGYTKEEQERARKSHEDYQALIKKQDRFIHRRLYVPAFKRYLFGDTLKLYQLLKSTNLLHTFADRPDSFTPELTEIYKNLLEYGRKLNDPYAYFVSGYYFQKDSIACKENFEKAQMLGNVRAMPRYDWFIHPFSEYQRAIKAASKHGDLEPLTDGLASLWLPYKVKEAPGGKAFLVDLAQMQNGVRASYYTYGKRVDYTDQYRNVSLSLTQFYNYVKNKNSRSASIYGKLLADFHMLDDILVEGGKPRRYNPKKAFKLYKAAADNGLQSAYHPLGLLYKNGAKGVEVNETLARKYLELAVKDSNRKSILSLGQVYEHGIGGPADPVKAIQLYKKVASKANERISYEAFKGLERLSPKEAQNYYPRYIEKELSEIMKITSEREAEIKLLFMSENYALVQFTDTTYTSRSIEISSLANQYKEVEWIMVGNYTKFSLDFFDYSGEAYYTKYPTLRTWQNGKEINDVLFDKIHPKWSEYEFPGVLIFQGDQFVKFVEKSAPEGVITNYVKQLLEEKK